MELLTLARRLELGPLPPEEAVTVVIRVAERVAEQLSAMRLQQAKVSATLERLRSQRDFLQARQKVVDASLKLAGKKFAISVTALLALLAFVGIVWFAYDGSKIIQRLSGASSNIATGPENLSLKPMPLGIPEGQLEYPQQRLKGVLGADALAFSRDGGQLLVAHRDGRLEAWNLETGTVAAV